MTVRQKKDGRLEGQVKDARGNGVSDVTVFITADSPSHLDIAAITDGEGRFSFVDLIPGEYTVAVNVGQLELVYAYAEIQPNRTSRVEIVIPD
ncbi:MAG: carboxypeptidase-like regulatory domain-containing protein [Nitrospira sp.]|nr:carboxypeptidase-like regulatory domain-containing protein [Nitrospira sp.]